MTENSNLAGAKKSNDMRMTQPSSIMSATAGSGLADGDKSDPYSNSMTNFKPKAPSSMLSRKSAKGPFNVKASLGRLSAQKPLANIDH